MVTVVLCVKIRKEKAEATRRALVEAGAFDPSHAPKGEGGFVFFPVTLKPAGMRLAYAQKDLLSREKRFTSISDALAGTLAPDELGKLVRSFDVIGDIAVMEIPDSLAKKEKLVARAVLDVHRNVRVVAKKTGPMAGAYRVRALKIIGGEKRTETLHREHGSAMYVDVAKVYFSPRLSFERKRIAQQVKKGENILALFAGVGPFPLAIARRQKNVSIAAVELNPDAVLLLRRNVAMNRFSGVIAPVLGDVHDVVPRDYAGWADRIVMPLPKDAHEFLADALLAAKPGCVVHFYHFGPIGSAAREARALIRAAARKGKRRVEFLSDRVVRPFSPATEQVSVDFKVR